MNIKRTTGILLLDVERAFDRVCRKGLIYKMIQTVGTQKSAPRTTEAGVPQGAVLTTMLYNYFTSDIPRTASTSLALYADDTAILATSWRKEEVRRQLQLAVDELHQWFTRWKVKINAEKIQAILIGRKQDPISGNINIEGQEVTWTREVRYLGVILDRQHRQLTWKTQTKNAIDKVTGCHLKRLQQAESKLLRIAIDAP